MREVYAGVMSGTSLDGVDAVVAEFATGSASGCTLLAAVHVPFPPGLRDALLGLQRPGDNELARAYRAANALADAYAHAISKALHAAGVSAADVEAAGVHGQTLRHCPEEGWTIQLNNPARIAEHAGVRVVADFRSRDVAAGGQGAPLVPVFHAMAFGGDIHRVVLNVGGIANVTDLPVHGEVRGFDTGPGNVLLDLWHSRHREGTFDNEGNWALTGRVDGAVLDAFLREPFFAMGPPKSTGRDLFNGSWLDAKLAGFDVAPADVQATLVALTARSASDAVRAHCSAAREVLVCGGGAKNRALMDALARELAPRGVMTTATRGVAVDHVEALAFAWLARETLAGRPGNLPAVTGARGPRILGAIYPR